MKAEEVNWKIIKRFFYVLYRRVRYWIYTDVMKWPYFVVRDNFNSSDWVYYVCVDGGVTRRRYMAYNWDKFTDCNKYANDYNTHHRLSYKDGCIAQNLTFGYQPMKNLPYIDKRVRPAPPFSDQPGC